MRRGHHLRPAKGPPPRRLAPWRSAWRSRPPSTAAKSPPTYARFIGLLKAVAEGESDSVLRNTRRELGCASKSGEAIRNIGFAHHNAHAVLGMEIAPDGTLYTAGPDTPIYVQHNRLIIRQVTLDPTPPPSTAKSL